MNDNNINSPKYSETLRRALDMFEEMQAAGFAIVPVVPDEMMLAAGAKVGGIAEERAAKIYAAMLHAAADFKAQ